VDLAVVVEHEDQDDENLHQDEETLAPRTDARKEREGNVNKDK